MKHKLLFLMICVIVLGTIGTAAQSETPQPKLVVGGVLNGKAVSLAKPAYPAAAKAVNASGAVNVQVTIDEAGGVIAAAAVSGHPLLRAAAVEAARQSKFTPTLLQGQPVKVTGVIVYNFVSGTPGSGGNLGAVRTFDWFHFGNALATLEKSPTLRYFDTASMLRIIPADWASEREQLQRIEELKQTELENGSGRKPVERIITRENTKDSDEKTIVSSSITDVTVSPEKQTSPETDALGQSLISSIQGRLAPEPVRLWYFNLGINFNRALLNADSRSQDVRLKSVRPLRQFAETAPVEIPAGIVEEVLKAAETMEKGVFTDADKLSLSDSMTSITRMIGNQ